MDGLIKSLQPYLMGRSLFEVGCFVCAVVFVYRLPNLGKALLDHRRDMIKINAEVERKRKKLDAELVAKLEKKRKSAVPK